MSNRKRLMIEIAVALLLVLICFAVWSATWRGGERRLAELEARQESAANQMRDLPGTTEIAAPFQGASGRVAVLWLGYKTRELLAAGGQEQAPSGK